MYKNGPYEYVAGPNTLGIGADNLALVRPPITVDPPIYGPRYNVRQSFAPLMGAAQFPLDVSVPRVGLRGNGVYMSGAMALSALTEYNKANNLS